jgi:hypothetical protein
MSLYVRIYNRFLLVSSYLLYGNLKSGLMPVFHADTFFSLHLVSSQSITHQIIRGKLFLYWAILLCYLVINTFGIIIIIRTAFIPWP